MKMFFQTLFLKMRGYKYALPKTPRQYVVTLHRVGCYQLHAKRFPSRVTYFKTLTACQIASGKRDLLGCENCISPKQSREIEKAERSGRESVINDYPLDKS